MQEKDRPEADASGLSLRSNKRGVIMNHSLYLKEGELFCSMRMIFNIIVVSLKINVNKKFYVSKGKFW
ncbi:hypothetical protein [Rossellomorea sp. LJF3]|uniref:hypothetical protein n=1 Tax=Rossellomorea sp. LJF3 TaxID=3126099 RepID=UPI00300D0CBA